MIVESTFENGQQLWTCQFPLMLNSIFLVTIKSKTPYCRGLAFHILKCKKSLKSIVKISFQFDGRFYTRDQRNSSCILLLISLQNHNINNYLTNYYWKSTKLSTYNSSTTNNHTIRTNIQNLCLGFLFLWPTNMSIMQ